VSSAVHKYHDGTKHHFRQFARSLGYLDWASQPHPFRSFAGAPTFPLFPSPQAAPAEYRPRSADYFSLFESVDSGESPPISAAALGDLLRHALGLSAWKRYGQSAWSLRVNPSSGNLHPTEAYVVCGAVPEFGSSAGVFHYAPDRHLLERRCAFDAQAWQDCAGPGQGASAILVALTSIHWREAWKYGERAFRYCQHDLGHAIAALTISAAAIGWQVRMLPAWSQRTIAALTGIDRDADYIDAEREEPGCVLAIGSIQAFESLWNSGETLVATTGRGAWSGHASQLSVDHVQWTFIDEVAAATEDPGRPSVPFNRSNPGPTRPASSDVDTRRLVLQRRSAVAFDGRSSTDRGTFFRILQRVLPETTRAARVLWWTPRVHLALFVHRVDGLDPGLYLLPRGDDEGLRTVCGRDFLWEPVSRELRLICLARGDCRRLAQRLSCDQDIAADGFFSLGMIAQFDASLAEYGPSFYRHLFWETGFVGQLLYLEAEAAAARATGIGCFYDDPVHETLGLSGHDYQSLYHFTVGIPVEDTRLTSEPGYGWS
jgi:SagB-type dehydrogenase family enzyme